MDDHFYTCEEVADILNSKVSTVRAYCKEGKIPSIKMGRGYRISQFDLEKWMKSKKDYELSDKSGNDNEKYKILFENSSDAIMMTDSTGYLDLVNSQFCNLLGYSKNQSEGLHFSKLIHPDDLPEIIESFMKTMNGEEDGVDLSAKLITKAKETVFVCLTKSALFEKGEVCGLQVIIRDLTDSKNKEDRIKILASMLNQTADAFVGIDEKRKIVYVNPAMLEMFGYKHDEMIGKNIGILHGTGKVNEEKAMISKMVDENGVWTGEIVNKRKNGQKFHCWVTVNKIADSVGHLIAYTAIIRNLDK